MTLDPDQPQSWLTTCRLFLGIYLMTAVNAVPYIWGNINVYTISYFHHRVHLETGVASSWTVALNSMAWGLGILFGAHVVQRIGYRLSMVTSTTVFIASISLCYLAVQHSIVLLNILIGVVCGFTFGLNQSLETMLITKWVKPEKFGRALCGIMLCQQIGLIATNLIILAFINPSNVPPDTETLQQRLFSQPEILDKVPYIFILYGGIAFVLGVLSCVLVWAATPSKTMLNKNKNANSSKCQCNNDGTKTTISPTQTDLKTVQSDKHLSHPDEVQQRCKYNVKSIKHPDKSDKINDTLSEKMCEKIEVEEKSVDCIHCLDTGESSDITPKQALKTKTFYAMVMVIAFSDISCIILNTYYKIFGLLFYPDDRFFSNMGIWMNVGTIVASYLCGIAADKFTVKNTMVAYTALLCLVSSSFYLSACISKWLYFVLGLVYNGCTLSLYIMVLVCSTSFFGKTHATTIHGLALASMYVTNTVIPVIVGYVLTTFGWLTLLTSVSVFFLVGLMVVVVFLNPVHCSNIPKGQD